MIIRRPNRHAVALPVATIAAASARLRRFRLLTPVVLGVALSPSTALAAANGTDRPLTGRGTGTTTVDFFTGATIADFTGHISHLGAETGHDNLALTITGPGTFAYSGMRTFVAASGDTLFSHVFGSGTFTPAAAESTEADIITGGTGRFAGASGMYTDTISFVVVSVTATSQTSRFATALQGHISY